MNEPFFITGLPRSRLAWLSVLLTWDESFCHHAALAGCSSMEQFKEKMSSPESASVIGDADPLIGCVAEEFLETFPDSKVVFVFRSFREAFEAEKNAMAQSGLNPVSDEDLHKYFSLTSDGLGLLWKQIPSSRKLFVQFNDLDREATIRQIWDFCLPEIAFWRERWQALDGLKISMICAKTFAKYSDQPFKKMLEKGTVLCHGLQ